MDAQKTRERFEAKTEHPEEQEEARRDPAKQKAEQQAGGVALGRIADEGLLGDQALAPDIESGTLDLSKPPKPPKPVEKKAPHPDLHGHLQRLRERAKKMRDEEKKRGVEIWSEICRLSVEFHGPRKDITDAEKYDQVIGDMAAVFNGHQSDGNLQAYQSIIPGEDSHVGQMLDVLDQRKDRVTKEGQRYIGDETMTNIDSTEGEDFKPHFRDKSKNQVFHTNFYVMLGYAAANDPLANKIANQVHEMENNEGASVNDWNAGVVGNRMGQTFRQMRDKGAGMAGLRAMPAMIGGAFSNHPQDFARPYGAQGEDYSELTQQLSDTVDSEKNHPLGKGVAANLATSVSKLGIHGARAAYDYIGNPAIKGLKATKHGIESVADWMGTKSIEIEDKLRSYF